MMRARGGLTLSLVSSAQNKLSSQNSVPCACSRFRKFSTRAAASAVVYGPGQAAQRRCLHSFLCWRRLRGVSVIDYQGVCTRGFSTSTGLQAGASASPAISTSDTKVANSSPSTTSSEKSTKKKGQDKKTAAAKKQKTTASKKSINAASFDNKNNTDSEGHLANGSEDKNNTIGRTKKSKRTPVPESAENALGQSDSQTANHVDANKFDGITISEGVANYEDLFGDDETLKDAGVHMDTNDTAANGSDDNFDFDYGAENSLPDVEETNNESATGEGDLRNEYSRSVPDRGANEYNSGAGTKNSKRAFAGASEDGDDDESFVLDPFTPSLEQEDEIISSDADGSGEGGSKKNDPERAAILAFTDMLCDDLYYCKTSVLRSFARTRRVRGTSKGEVVMRLIESADRDAHGENRDLSTTRRVLGDVFGPDVRTSGRRTAWTDQALEASHIEMACDRHLHFEVMANTQKTLMVRRNAGEAARVLRKLSRPFQQNYEMLAKQAVGGVYRPYKAEADELVAELSGPEVLSPFAAFLVSHVRYGSSLNLLTRADVNGRLIELELVRPLIVESSDRGTQAELMLLLDDVAEEVEQRQQCYGEKRLQWGQDTAATLVAAAHALGEGSLHVADWNTAAAPSWVHDLARMFDNWERIVRTDVPKLADVPRYCFDVILSGVASFALLQKIYGDGAVTPTDVPVSTRASIKEALLRHFKDAERAAASLEALTTYVMARGGAATAAVSGRRSSGGGSGSTVRPEFFAGVLTQMQGAFHEQVGVAQHHDRVAVILKEVTATVSRCTRSCGMLPLLVKLTEDMRFHFRFQRVFKRMSTTDRQTVRVKQSLNMVKTLDYFEKQFAIQPLSTRAVAFLAIQLVYLALQSDGAAATDNHSGSHSGGGGDARPAVLQRFASVTGRPELAVVGLTEVEATHVRDLRIAFPPQLSYRSWLGEADTKEKSVYNVLPSVAVKGSANQAMIVSQAPMMRALDAISRVPWRINRYMLHVQEAIVREGFGFGKIRPGFYPLHYTNLRRGDIRFPSADGDGYDDEDDDGDRLVFNLIERARYDRQMESDWKELSELRSSRIHYLQALRQARSILDFSHIYFPNSMDFRGRMYPLPGRLNHTGSDPFRGLLEYAEPKPLGAVGLYWLKVHLANKMGANKLSFDERVHYVDEHIADVVQSAESPLSGDKWWQEASEPLQCLMACKELADALKCSQGPEHFLSRLPVAVDGSYNGLQHYSAIGRDAAGAALVNLVPSERPADAYTGILKEMLRSIEAEAARDHPVARRCLGTGRGQDHDHIKRKTIKRPIMTQVYGVTGYGMSEQILDELVKQNKSHGLWTATDMREMAAYLRDKVLESLGVTFAETQNCRRWIAEVVRVIWEVQPAELRTPLCWTTPLGLVVRQPYRVRKEAPLFTAHGFTKAPGDAAAPASRKQLSAIAPNLIHSLDATHLAMTALEMQGRGLCMMAVHDSYWTYAADLPTLSQVLREQFVNLYSAHDPLWELKQQWEEMYFRDLRRHGATLPDPPPRGTLDLNTVLVSPYFFS